MPPPAPESQATQGTQAYPPTFASNKCVGRPAEAAICDVSLVDLIANPEDFLGHRVIVHGFVHVGFEDSGIYLHRDDFDNGLMRNGLWLEGGEDLDVSKCQDKYSILEGTFSRGGMSGHIGMWSGSINKITRCEALGPVPESR
jgi:hypothetical protein